MTNEQQGKHKVNKKEFWESKYIQNHMPWDIGQVAPAFVKYFTQSLELQALKVAVLGCGRGHDAFYLAQLENKGNKNCKLDVYGFDFSNIAIRFCNELKKRKRLNNINFYQVDFFKLGKSNEWKNSFDYVVEHTTLCAVDPERKKEYVDLVKHILKPKGKLIGLFFVRPIELGGPPFGSTQEEIKQLFCEDFIEEEELRYEECLHAGKLEGDEYLGIFRKK